MLKKLFIVVALMTPLLALAETPDEKGLTIAKEQEARGKGFKDYTADMEMLLKNSYGDESKRYLKIFALEVEGDGDKSKMVFDRPADVKGTAILTFSHGLEPDDQWLFLPAVKRVKRLNSRSKSGPFMGSEFAYEDLSSPVVEKYSYKYLKDEACSVGSCFVVERVPAYEFSGYTKQITWIDTAEYRTVKIEYYDRKDELLKTLENSDWNLYMDKFWRAGKGMMINHQTGKSTLLTTSNFEFSTGLNDRDFTSRSLERTR